MGLLASLGQVAYDIIANDGTGTGTAGAQRNMMAVGAAMTGVGVGAKLMVDDVNRSFLEFDGSMTAVQALGAMSEEEFGKMRDAALDMSTQVPISAVDVSDAMYKMVSVGYDFDTMMATIPEATKLAVGGNQELADSVDTVINVFGAYGTEAYTAADITNILAKAVGVGKWELGDFTSEIMRSIGSAANLGISFDELAAANVLLQNKFTSAEVAGTSMNAMLARLINPAVIKDLEEMGVHVKDNEGNFVGLESVLNQLDTALSKTGGNVDRMSILQQLFGQDGVKAAMALLDEKDKLGQLSGQMNDAAYKEQAYHTVVESTGSKLEIATNKMTAAKIALATGMIPATELAADVMGGLAGVLSGLPTPLQGVAGMALYAAQGFAALGPALMGLAALKGLGLAGTLGSIATGISGMGTSAGIAAISMGPLLPILVGLAIGLAAVYLLKEIGFLDWVGEQGANCGKWLIDLGAAWGQAAKDAGAATSDILSHKGFLDWVGEEGKITGKYLIDLGKSFRGAADEIKASVDLLLDQESRLNQGTSSELGGAAAASKTQTGEITKSHDELNRNVTNSSGGVVKSLGEMAQGAKDEYKKFEDYSHRFFVVGAGDQVEDGTYKIGTAASKLVKGLAALPAGVAKVGADTVVGVAKFGVEFVGSLGKTQQGTDEEVNKTNESVDKLGDHLPNVADLLIEGAWKINEILNPALTGVGAAAIEGSAGVLGADLPGALGSAVEGAASRVTGPALAIYDDISGMAGGAFRVLKDQWGIDIPGAFGTVSEGFSALGPRVQTAFTNLFSGISEYIVNLAGGFISAGYNIIMFLVQGMKSATGAVGEAIGGILGFLSQFLPHSPAQMGPLSVLPNFGAYLVDPLLATVPQIQAASSQVATAAAVTMPVAQPASLSGGTTIGTQDNSAPISIGNVNASKDYNVSAIMADIATMQAQKRAQKGVTSG